MLIYWILFLVPVYFLLGKFYNGANTPKWAWLTFGFFLLILIGLRHQVGCDWLSYSEGLQLIEDSPLEVIYDLRKEVGYTLLSWLSLFFGLGIYGVNFFCSIIFTGGLIYLSRSQPLPWLTILVAIPYLVIVVAMGYTRQAAAIGFLMYGFVYLFRGKTTLYLAYVLFAGLFHKTAFVFAAFAILRTGGGKLKQAVGICVLISLIGSAYFLEQAEIFMFNYVQNTMKSDGGQIRVLMNCLPASIFFWYWKKWGQKFEDRWLWGMMSLLAIMCLPLVAIASTAVDRMALYLIPLQLVVWARVPLLIQGQIERNSAILIIIAYSAVVQFTWLFFGTHADCWVPYDNLLFPSFLI
jgi:hypothetical protein